MDEEPATVLSLSKLLPVIDDEQYKTTTRTHFIDHRIKNRIKIFKPKEQTDPGLISGHHVNNLKVNKLELRTRTWPKSMNWREEYRQFVLRLKLCGDPNYQKFFSSPSLRYEYAEQFMKEWYKTVYGIDYSPGAYESRVSRKRKVIQHDPNIHVKDYPTSYGHYHNRMWDLDELSKSMGVQEMETDKSKDALNEQLRKLFKKYILSTYYAEICKPALRLAKDGIMPRSPIDRHMLRRM